MYNIGNFEMYNIGNFEVFQKLDFEYLHEGVSGSEVM